MTARTTTTKVPSAATRPTPSGLLQRKCACGGKAAPDGECEECRQKHEGTLQRLAVNSASPAKVPPIVREVLRTPGRPLDTGTRAVMEPRFGHDFSRVRVHDDARAAASARAVDAQAYTVGEHIVFDSGRYNPSSSAGRQLLAHELAHTVQQHGLQRSATDPNLPSKQEDRRLEKEAEAMAASALHGRRPEPAAVSSPDRPVVSRAASGCDFDKTFEKLANPAGGPPPDHIPLKVKEPFRVPKEKGPVGERWNAVAQAGGLRASLDLGGGASKVDIKQDRPELRATWLTKVHWPAAEADQRWSELAAEVRKETPKGEKDGGKKKPKAEKEPVEQFPKLDGVACHMDHIIELQVFGGNEPENIQVLDPTPNMSSGSQIRNDLSELGRCAKEGLKKEHPAGVLLVWSKATQDEVQCGPCCQIEQKAVAGAPAGGKKAPSSEGLEVERKPVSFLGKKAEILIPKGAKQKKQRLPLRGSDITENRAMSRLIPGLSLVDYALEEQTLKATFDPHGVRLPVALKEKAGKEGEIKVAIDNATGELSVQEGKPHVPIPIQYASLSDGVIESVTQDGTGLAGKGTITPSIPLLKGAHLGFEFAQNHLAVTTEIPKEKLKPLPFMRVTQVSLKLDLAPEFKPSGTIGFEFGPANKPVATGSIEATADAQGFLAKGHLNARIPGLDEATGDVTYRREPGWAGTIQLKTSKSYLKNASVVLGLSDQGLEVNGALALELPGEQKVDLTVEKKHDTWIYKGSGEFKAPGGVLDPVKIDFTYDGEKVKGDGKTGFTYKSLKGHLAVHYEDGKLSGKGTLEVDKGRAKGKIHVRMSPAQKFSGSGEITYQVSPNLVATAGIAVDENEKVTVKGALEFPKPIELFPAAKGDIDIFSVGVSIPIPGASVGPVGLKARIEGGLSAGYHIGPGELRNARIETVFNPLEDQPDLDLDMKAQLFIAAGAHVSGRITGAIMVDVGIASASGGLTITATATLDGHLASQVEIHYAKGRFEVEADLDLLLALVLKLALTAFVEAEAGVWRFKVSTRKDWELASYTYDPGLKLGLKTKSPLRYVSDQPFKAPSLDQIEFIKPKIDPSDVLSRVFSSAGGTETTK